MVNLINLPNVTYLDVTGWYPFKLVASVPPTERFLVEQVCLCQDLEQLRRCRKKQHVDIPLISIQQCWCTVKPTGDVHCVTFRSNQTVSQMLVHKQSAWTQGILSQINTMLGIQHCSLYISPAEQKVDMAMFAHDKGRRFSGSARRISAQLFSSSLFSGASACGSSVHKLWSTQYHLQ